MNTRTLEGSVPTVEQLQFRLEQKQRELEKAYESVREKAEMLRREKLILRGMVSDQFHIRVSISPEMLTSNAFEVTQALLSNYVGRTVYEIEEKLGGPLRRLQEALMHIHYLENHASRSGLQFTPFDQRASDKWLYY